MSNSVDKLSRCKVESGQERRLPASQTLFRAQLIVWDKKIERWGNEGVFEQVLEEVLHRSVPIYVTIWPVSLVFEQVKRRFSSSYILPDVGCPHTRGHVP
jgi:hypothetical protein